MSPRICSSSYMANDEIAPAPSRYARKRSRSIANELKRARWYESRLAQSLQHFGLWEEGRGGKKKRKDPERAAWNTTPSRQTFWCVMFFNETSHSHQSTLLSSTHTARQGKGGGRQCEIEYAGAKSDDLCRVCACLSVWWWDEEAHRWRQSCRDQARRSQRTAIRESFIERFFFSHEINPVSPRIADYFCLIKRGGSSC